MKVFVYNWEIKQKDPKVIILAHSLTTENKYHLNIIDYFFPFCFVEPQVACNARRSEDMLMRTSRDINRREIYSKVTFDNYSSMMNECSRHGYMTDISMITMFLSEYNFPFTGWFETNPLLKPVQDIVPTFPKILSFDIECISSSGIGMPQPYKRGDRIEMISMVSGTYLGKDRKNYLIYVGTRDEILLEDCECICCSTEQDLLRSFGEVVTNEDPDVITGYNIFEFDFDYILKRCKLTLSPLPEISRSGETTTHPVEWSSGAYGQNFYNRVEASGRIFIDMILFFRRMHLGSHSLDSVSRRFLGVGKKDISHEKVWRDRSLIEEYAKYCINDSVLTLDLFNMFYMWTEVCEMSRTMMCSIEDIYTRGEQIKVLNQVVHSCISRKIVLQKMEKREPWSDLKGALVIEPVVDIYPGCVVLDFASMYPSIMISHNICPSTYIGYRKFSQSIPGILPQLAKQLIDERKKVKDMMKNEDGMVKQILQSRQQSLKISANSLYGVLGFEKNKYLGHQGCSSSITGIGRSMLKMVIEHITKIYERKVIYGDTDSCVIHYGKDMSEEECIEASTEICEDINSNLLIKPMSLSFEEYYNLMIFFSKKRYIMFKGDSIKYKGVAKVRSNYCNYVKDCYEKLIKSIGRQDDMDSMKRLIINCFVNLLQGEVSLDDLVLTKSVKPLEQYKTTSPPQYIMASRLLAQGENWESRLEYIFIDNGGRLQGHKMYTPYEVERNDMPIDYKYYLDKQLVPALKDLISVVGLGGYVSAIRSFLDEDF
jgi:DNA polymerase delta subunit 1